MKRELKVRDIVLGPCSDFNTGETRLEEHIIKEIGADRIVTTHVADLRKQDGKFVRIECPEKDYVGNADRIRYFSRTVDEILREHVEDNKWLCEQMLQVEPRDE